MTGIKRLPYGPLRFELALSHGNPYLVQASADFKNWQRIGEGVAQQPVIEFVDSEAFKFNHRFYRVIIHETPSANVIGYASTTVPPGFSMIASPFSNGGTVEELLAGWPDGTTLSRFDTRLFRMNENAVAHGKWRHPAERLQPGEGAILFNPSNDYKSLSFVGEVEQGDLSAPIPAGFSIRSSQVPRFGQLQEDLRFPIAEGDVVHLFDRDRQGYVLYPFENGKWQNGSPVVSLCEAFWIAKTDAANWRQNIEISEFVPET